jgi:predicted ester cyclase
MQLVLLRPPYADAIRYSTDTAGGGDLSHLAAGPFIAQLRRFAAESLRVLAPQGRCALLIDDLRRQGHVVPLGFAAIQACRHEGLALEDLVIKRQHYTRMADRWAAISSQRGFLLLAHEYLAVFRRPDDLQSRIEDLVAEGDRVVVRWTTAGTQRGELLGVPPTGKRVTLTGISILRVAGEQIAEEWTTWDALAVHREIGAAPN